VYLADYCRWLADAEFRGHAPLYEAVARGLAGDTELLERLAPLAEPKFVPVLLNAAVHDLVLREPDQPLATIYRTGTGDPWPPYRALVRDRFDELAEMVGTRVIQTNEVGRSAAVRPALEAVSTRAGRPLALVELGPSAGLNLLADRYAVTYVDAATDPPTQTSVGPPGSPVQLRCELIGPARPPPPAGELVVAWRAGIDRRPVDARDTDARRWLRACLWPGQRERAARLDAALAIARAEPPDLRSGDAVATLPEVLAEAPAHGEAALVVLATWVLAYLADDERAALADVLTGAGRPVWFVTAEYPGVAPWVPAPSRPTSAGAGTGATLVGLALWDGGLVEAQPLAWMQAHGTWLDWLGDPS
jgi:hypothetical protein